MKNSFEDISQFGWALIASIISLIIYIILEKFKSRWATFTYTKKFNSVATTIDDNLHGNIKVIYNDKRVVKHLNFVTLNILNDSNTDFENVRIKCWVDVDSQCLSFEAYHDQYRTAIKLDEEFKNAREEKLQEIEDYENSEDKPEETPKYIQNNYDYLLKNIQWNIPVWNRKDSVTFNFLIENFNGDTPLLMHPIEKKSIRLIQSEDIEMRNNRRGKWMLINGYVLYAITVTIIMSQQQISYQTLIFFVIIGGLYIWIGLFLYHVFIYLKSFFK